MQSCQKRTAIDEHPTASDPSPLTLFRPADVLLGAGSAVLLNGSQEPQVCSWGGVNMRKYVRTDKQYQNAYLLLLVYLKAAVTSESVAALASAKFNHFNIVHMHSCCELNY